MKEMIVVGLVIGFGSSFILMATAASVNLDSLSKFQYWWDLTEGFFVIGAIISFIAISVLCTAYRFIELVIEDKKGNK